MSDNNPWLLDEARRLYYQLDYERREYLYQNGLRIPFPESQPRTTPESSMPRASETQAPPSATASSPTYELAGTATIGYSRRLFEIRSREFFRPHRVVMWQPVASDPGLSSETMSLLSNIRDEDRTKHIRRAIVIQEPGPGDHYVRALQISTYGGKGVAAADVKKHEHGIVYTDRSAPKPHRNEEPARSEGAGGMTPNPIQVTANIPTEKLAPFSRINYGQPVLIPIASPIHDIGRVATDSQGALIQQYKFVQERKCEAEQYRADSQKLREQGQHEQTILQYLITAYRRKHPELSWEQASDRVQRLLTFWW